MTPKQREIEQEYGEPFADVVRGYAEMGYSRSDVAGILGYSRPHFTRCVLPALPPMPWPSRGRGNAVRDVMRRTSDSLHIMARRGTAGDPGVLACALNLHEALAAGGDQ